MYLNYDDTRLHYHTEVLSLLANPKRLEICIRLLGFEKGVSSLSEELGISQSALSQHLTKLRELKLVSVRSCAQFRYYTCEHPGVRQILKVLSENFDRPLD
ncbi:MULTISPECIES: ArsR/SmtB family transcription factor [unclassified Rhizobium]|uniref:ArsR/SmtB family transcription factor n=1 Tax=unclassified Rhizobium TaxID=2613769 RepID=UPI003828DEAF